MGFLGELSGIVQQYSSGGAPPDPNAASQHFQQVANQVPPSALSGALAAIFRSPQTGSFGQNISSMFDQSDSNQRAGILNTLLASGASGVLAKLGLSPGTTEVTTQQAQQVSPGAVEEAANHAAQQDPSLIQRASEFYAQHPGLVQALGSGAAVFAMQHFSKTVA